MRFSPLLNLQYLNYTVPASLYPAHMSFTLHFYVSLSPPSPENDPSWKVRAELALAVSPPRSWGSGQHAGGSPLSPGGGGLSKCLICCSPLVILPRYKKTHCAGKIYRQVCPHAVHSPTRSDHHPFLYKVGLLRTFQEI